MERDITTEHVNSICEYAEVLGCGMRILRIEKGPHENEAREEHMDSSLDNIKLLLSVEQKTLTATVKKNTRRSRMVTYSMWKVGVCI